jgi:hypothetical protein
MLGGKRRSQPHSNAPDLYSERLNASLSTYNAEPTVPVGLMSITQSPLTSTYRTPSVAPKMRAFFKSNFWRLDGIRNYYSWGAVNQGANTASLPSGGGMDGTVRSTAFQPILVQLDYWSINLGLRQAGFNATGGAVFNGSKPIRYDYPSFRVPQINTALTGGAGPSTMRMQQRPRFTAVQRTQRPIAVPRYYNTQSRNGWGGSTGGSSNVNTPGT